MTDSSDGEVSSLDFLLDSFVYNDLTLGGWNLEKLTKSDQAFYIPPLGGFSGVCDILGALDNRSCSKVGI